jgi:nicotinate-nucleotide adenylyltransferase
MFSRGQMRVGLLGGSFNPAHQGHRLISQRALQALKLQQIWWLVSPQNPLKPRQGMAPYGQRLAGAKAAARHPRIRVCEMESSLGTRFTIDLLKQARRRYPRYHFVWLAGADILTDLHRWRRWPDIFATTPIAIFDRPGYVLEGMRGKAAQRFSASRRKPEQAAGLALLGPPAWMLVTGPRSTQSGTSIRHGRSQERFAGAIRNGGSQERFAKPSAQDANRREKP